MKGKNVLENLCLLSLVLLAMAGQSQQQSFNSTCGPDKHCAVNKGLICQLETCQCGNGPVSDSLWYEMKWDEQIGECVALENGVCIGTESNPVDDDTLKKVKCGDNLVCKQVDNMPLGVGVCFKAVAADSGFGESCGPHQHCVVNKGLICSEGTCQCGGGELSKDVEYKMKWDTKEGECVASDQGACIGTENYSIDEITSNLGKVVKCGDNLICKQVENMPNGVGICTKGTNEEGEGGGGGSGASDKAGALGLITMTSIFTIVLSMFTHK